jgi:hypothetical protein
MKLKSLLQTDMSDLKSVKLDDVRSQLQSNPVVLVKLLAVILAVVVLAFG